MIEKPNKEELLEMQSEHPEFRLCKQCDKVKEIVWDGYCEDCIRIKQLTRKR